MPETLNFSSRKTKTRATLMKFRIATAGLQHLFSILKNGLLSMSNLCNVTNNGIRIAKSFISSKLPEFSFLFSQYFHSGPMSKNEKWVGSYGKSFTCRSMASHFISTLLGIGDINTCSFKKDTLMNPC